jgi:O-antigen/teichoic acid export membrane protein
MSVKNNIFYNVILAISQVLFPLITFPYLARVLEPNHIGVLNFAESIAKYFTMLSALGIPIYGIREIAKIKDQPKELSRTFSEILIIHVVSNLFSLAVFFILIYSSSTINIEKTLFNWTLVYFFLQVFYLEWFFNGINQFKFIAIRQFIVRVFFIALIFILIKQKTDYIKYMQMQVGLAILIVVINIRQVFKFINFNKENISGLSFKKHIKPIFYLFLTIFSISIYFSLDTIFLGFLSNNESVGFYSTALKLVKLIIAVLGAITVALFPSLVELYNKDEKDKFAKAIKDCFFVLISISIPLALLIGLNAHDIVIILFGENYERSVLPLQITSAMIVIVSMSSIFGFQVLNALSKDKSILISAVFGMLVSLVLSFWLIPLYNENGEAITILITELTVSISFIYFSYKYFPIQGLSKIFIEQLVAAIPYIFIVLFAQYFISLISIRICLIAILSLSWFLILHFKVLRDNLFKNQFDLVYSKIFN